jgi:hypothetical protein
MLQSKDFWLERHFDDTFNNMITTEPQPASASAVGSAKFL